MSWKISNGKLRTEKLEVNVVHHCNLSCRGCAHLSNRIPRYFISPEKLERQLSTLSKHVQTKTVSLLGGEPLLHPDLPAVVTTVRRSGITERIRLVTNGLLLSRMTDQLWNGVDEVHVSLYPSHPMKVGDLVVFQKNAKKGGAHLSIRYQNHFQEVYSQTGTTDEALIHRIYATCAQSHEAGCHTLFEGYYYKCEQAVLFPYVKKDLIDGDRFADGIRIVDDNNLAQRIADYLSSDQTLRACRYCLGSVGKRFIPKQVQRHTEHEYPPSEELVDWKRLTKLENRNTTIVYDVLRRTRPMFNRFVGLLPASIRLSPAFRTLAGKVESIARRLAGRA